ncbi:hypothetical protein LTR85_000802 [Meristemomyces frigidus]|nr:hypothetical protein LTR85_000802 [Meristemomyces frigidus]
MPELHTPVGVPQYSDEVPTGPGLLIIPQELRDQIYDHLLVDENRVIDMTLPSRACEAKNSINRNYHAICLTCRQLYREGEEAKIRFLQGRTFALWVSVISRHRFAKLEQVIQRARHLALYRLISYNRFRHAHARAPYACVLKVSLCNGSMEHSVFLEHDESAVFARGLQMTPEKWRTSGLRTAEVEQGRRFAESDVEPAMETLRIALLQAGKLDSIMLRALYQAVMDVW